MLQQLKEQVCEANLRLLREGLVILTWGNASAASRVHDLMVIKPSGVSYHEMRPEHMVVVSLKTGEIVEGHLRPSSDTPTHLEIYRAFHSVNGIAHVHSTHATAWAQSGREIPALGTTHADHFYGAIPCTRELKTKEIQSDYEKNTGLVIIERFKKIDPLHIPAVLVAGHAPFAWGATLNDAVQNAIVLEQVARMANETLAINPKRQPLSKALLDKHFRRKHGASAYYGQKKK
ncbi:MAG: L-ribulose-5-phosphate 4-epimerase AraD [Ignavibacteriae bacterium]|nr:L-ribulose-5-phosphate 4-epimerase AraD [Ignavibacteriota bacterium]